MVPNNSSQETMTRTNASTPGSPKYETTIPTTGSWRQEALNSSLMISSQNSDEETAEFMKIKASKSPWHWKTFYKHRSPWSQASSTSIVYLKVHRTTNPKSIHWKTAICCCWKKSPQIAPVFFTDSEGTPMCQAACDGNFQLWRHPEFCNKCIQTNITLPCHTSIQGLRNLTADSEDQ